MRAGSSFPGGDDLHPVRPHDQRLVDGLVGRQEIALEVDHGAAKGTIKDLEVVADPLMDEVASSPVLSRVARGPLATLLGMPAPCLLRKRDVVEYR